MEVEVALGRSLALEAVEVRQDEVVSALAIQIGMVW